MSNSIAISFIISVIYILFNIIRMKFVQENKKTIKEITKDSLVVFSSSLVSLFIAEQFNYTQETLLMKLNSNGQPDVFVDNPGF